LDDGSRRVACVSAEREIFSSQIATDAFTGIEAARSRSPLKEAPDRDAAHTLLMELHRSVLGL
jgi:hypothetical protein